MEGLQGGSMAALAVGEARAPPDPPLDPPLTGASTVAAGLRPGSVPPARVRAERMPAAEAFVSAATSHPCALGLQAPPVPRLPRGITLLIPRALMRDFLNKILR